MSIEAMKQALEALENVRIDYDFHGNPADDENKMIAPAITALRTAIEQAEKSNINQVIHLYDKPPAAPVQEPVACIRSLTDQCAALIKERDELQKQVWRYEKHGVTCQTYGDKVESSCSECNVHENYTNPPAAQREWVGLTDYDLSVCDEDGVVLARYWEAKLKEKNT